MSPTIQPGRHPHAVSAQHTNHLQGRAGWRRHHILALGVTVMVVAAMAGCTAQPATQPEAEASPTTAVVVPLLAEQPRAPLEPGAYVADVDGVSSTAPLAPVLRIPEGFFPIDGTGVNKNDSRGYRVVWLWDVTSVFTHPCDLSGSPEPVGPSVADLAGALAAQPMREATIPVPVTIGGYDGLYVELSTPDDLSACREGYFRTWPGREDNGTGLTDLIWIIDVEGQRITFDLSYPPGTTPEEIDELKEIVTTATFVEGDGA